MLRMRAAALGVWILGCMACTEEQQVQEPVAPEALCVDDQTFFAQNVWPQVLQSKCLGCHNAQGIARETEFVMMPSAQPGYMETNQEVLSYLSSLERDGTSFILLKPTEAMPHGGGKVLSEDSAEYATLAAFAERVRNPIECETSTTAQDDPFKGVSMMSFPRTLRRASLSLAGRLPTADEYATVDRLGATGVELVLMNLMKEQAFSERLKEMFNDIFLTDRFLGGNNMLERLDGNRYPAYWYESSAQEIADEDQRQSMQRRYRNYANEGAARAALELVAFVVAEDRPFSEILTADYMMVNPYSARSFGVEVDQGAFPDGGDHNEYDHKTTFPFLYLKCPRQVS